MAGSNLLSPSLVSEETFAPFGEIIAERGDPLPHVYGDTMKVYLGSMHECDTELMEFVVAVSPAGQKAFTFDVKGKVARPLYRLPFLFVVAVVPSASKWRARTFFTVGFCRTR